MRRVLLVLTGLIGCCCRAGAAAPDPFRWLEDVNSPRAMAWVRGQNATTLARLQADPGYKSTYDTALKLAQDPDRIALPMTIGGMIYNLWQDGSHVQGIWRRTTLDDYRSPAPHWTTLIDLDALSAQDHERWVWKNVTCWLPEARRCLISLSDGGEDAVVTREFDLQTGQFVHDGFYLPRSKMTVDWLDADTILAATDWGTGSLTRSGYPFIVKKLRRGQPLADAKPYFSGAPSDVRVDVTALVDGAGRHAMIVSRGLDFFHSQTLLGGADGATPLPLPQKIVPVGLCDGKLILVLNEPGKGAPTGSLAAFDLDHPSAPLVPIFIPGPRQSVQLDFSGGGGLTTRHQVIATIEDNVRGRVMAFTPGASGWTARTLPLPDDAAINVVDSSPRDDRVFFTLTGFLQPTTLYLDDLAAAGPPVAVKSLSAKFDASNDLVEQHEATSADGTSIPYFIVRPKTMRADGSNPTLLYAYGGFQVSMTPSYSPSLGKLWLERGGVYVLANIRGGGEFGPAWHEAGLKTHRQKIYDDFTAVARHLIATKVTDPQHLGIRGGSNGGLLMGVEFTQHPQLWRAVIIDVPLLDMLRFEHIAAGASWVGEYGSVANPAERAFLARISPYNNLHAGEKYPEPFIFTTTKDDRVGPQHARKFAARLASMHVPYLYYESIEGGHAAGANLREKAQESALEMTYLTEKLMD